nr:hypothetical protein HK105_007706 [Polyrhizophydium stewartii]
MHTGIGTLGPPFQISSASPAPARAEAIGSETGDNLMRQTFRLIQDLVERSASLQNAALPPNVDELWDLCRVLLRGSPLRFFKHVVPPVVGEGREADTWSRMLTMLAARRTPEAGRRVEKLVEWKMLAQKLASSLPLDDRLPRPRRTPGLALPMAGAERHHAHGGASAAAGEVGLDGRLVREADVQAELADLMMPDQDPPESARLAARPERLQRIALSPEFLHDDVVQIVRGFSPATAAEALVLFDRLRGQFDLQDINRTIISAAAAELIVNGKSSEATAFFDALSKERGERLSFNHIMQQLCRENLLRTKLSGWWGLSEAELAGLADTVHYGMRVIMSYMRFNNAHPDVITFNYLALFSRPKTFAEAKEFLASMREADVMPNRHTFCVLSNQLDARAATQLFAEADLYGVQTDATMLLHYISRCKTLKRPADALQAYFASRFRFELLGSMRTHWLSGPRGPQEYLLQSAVGSPVHIQDALALVRDMAEHRFLPYHESISMLVITLSRANRADDAAQLIMMLGSKLSPDYLSHQNRLNVLVGYCNTRNVDRAIGFLRDMDALGFPPANSMYGIVISSLVREHRFSEAQAWIDAFLGSAQMRIGPIDIVNNIFESFIAVGNGADGEKFLRTALDALNLKPDRNTIRLLVSLQLRSGREEHAVKIVEAIKASGIPVHPGITAQMIDFYSQTNQWDKADVLWTDALGAVSPSAGPSYHSVARIDDVILAARMRDLSARRDSAEARRIMRHITMARHPNAYRAGLTVMLQSGRLTFIDEAEKLLGETLASLDRHRDSTRKGGVSELDKRIVSQTICDFVSQFAWSGDLARAEFYLEAYMSLFQPSIRPFVPLIRTSVRFESDLGRAVRYWNRMQQLGLGTNVRAYNAIIAAHVDAGDVHGAMQLYEELVKRGHSPTAPLLRTLVCLYGRAGQAEDMEDVFMRIVQPDPHSDKMLRPNSEDLVALMTGYSFSNKLGHAVAVWLTMWRWRDGARGSRQSNARKQASVIESLVPAKDARAVAALLEPVLSLPQQVRIGVYDAMHQSAFGVPTSAVSVIFDVLGFMRRVDAIDELWSELRASRFPLSENNFTSLMEALFRSGEFERAIDVPLFLVQSQGNLAPSLKMLRNLIAMIKSEQSLSPGTRNRMLGQITKFVETRHPEYAKLLEFYGKMRGPWGVAANRTATAQSQLPRARTVLQSVDTSGQGDDQGPEQ